MKIRQNFILAYFLPLLIALFFFIAGISDKETAAPFFIIGLLIVAVCILEWRTTTLELKDGLIVGHSGIIKRQTLTSPLSKIHYCEYTTFLCFNKIRINAVTGQYTYKNMRNAAQFVDTVNKSIV